MKLSYLNNNNLLKSFAQSKLYPKYLIRNLEEVEDLTIKWFKKKQTRRKDRLEKRLRKRKFKRKFIKRNHRLRLKTSFKMRRRILLLDDHLNMYPALVKRKEIKKTGFFINEKAKLLFSHKRIETFKFIHFSRYKKINRVNLLKNSFNKIKTNQKRLFLVGLYGKKGSYIVYSLGIKGFLKRKELIFAQKNQCNFFDKNQAKGKFFSIQGLSCFIIKFNNINLKLFKLFLWRKKKIRKKKLPTLRRRRKKIRIKPKFFCWEFCIKKRIKLKNFDLKKIIIFSRKLKKKAFLVNKKILYLKKIKKKACLINKKYKKVC